MQAQQVQQQTQHQQITGANVILKMSDIQQLSTVGMFCWITVIDHITEIICLVIIFCSHFYSCNLVNEYDLSIQILIIVVSVSINV
jgi:hypothetical protein